MSRHSINPFKVAVDERDDDDEEIVDTQHMQQNPVASEAISSPSHSAAMRAADVSLTPAAKLTTGTSVLGPSGLYLSPVHSWLGRLTLMFPTRSSQWAAGLLLLLSLAGLVTWMALTIQTRWIDARTSPATSVNLEQVTSLPAAMGMLSMFHMDTWFNRTVRDTLHTTLYNVTAFPIDTAPFPPAYEAPALIPDHRYLWHTFHMSNGFDLHPGNQTALELAYLCEASTELELTPTTLCVARNYVDVVEQDADWPLVFDNTLAQFCVRTYRLVDPRAIMSIVRDSADGYSLAFAEFQYEDGPIYEFSMINLLDTYKLYRKYQAGEVADDPTNTALYADPISLAYNQQHDVSLRMNKRVSLAGKVSWEADLNFGGTRKMRPETIAQYFTDFYAANPELVAQLAADPNIVLDPTAANFTQQYFAETCLSPSSFTIQVVRETAGYGVVNFLSDLGQWRRTGGAGSTHSIRAEGLWCVISLVNCLADCV